MMPCHPILLIYFLFVDTLSMDLRKNNISKNGNFPLFSLLITQLPELGLLYTSKGTRPEMKLFSVPFLPVNVGVDSQHGINASENLLVMVEYKNSDSFHFWLAWKISWSKYDKWWSYFNVEHFTSFDFCMPLFVFLISHSLTLTRKRCI